MPRSPRSCWLCVPRSGRALGTRLSDILEPLWQKEIICGSLSGVMDWYIILEDSNGYRTKRYVGAVGYAYCEIGSYVVKKKGLGEYPRKPGDLTPVEVKELLRQKREQKQ